MTQTKRISSLLAEALAGVSEEELHGTGLSELTFDDADGLDPTRKMSARELMAKRARAAAHRAAAAAAVSDTVRPVSMPDVEELQPSNEPSRTAVVSEVRHVAGVGASSGARSVAAVATPAAPAVPTAAEIRAHMERVRSAREGTVQKPAKRSATWGLVAIAACFLFGVSTTGPARGWAQQGLAAVRSFPASHAATRAAAQSPTAVSAPTDIASALAEPANAAPTVAPAAESVNAAASAAPAPSAVSAPTAAASSEPGAREPAAKHNRSSAPKRR